MSSTRIPTNLVISQLANDIVRKQSSMAEVQEQIASGKKVNRPSDAPAHSAQLINMQEVQGRLEQYERNAMSAESQLSLEENALAETSNSLMRIRDLALGSNSGVVDDLTRQAYNSELKLRLKELYGLANSKDSYGNYLFGGTNSQNRPFTPGQPVNYAGSDDSLQITIAPGRMLQTGDSGADVYMRIRNGNGTFSARADSTNTGTGVIQAGSVTDISLYDATPYEIRFTSATNFDIVDMNSGATVQAGVTYKADENIEFSSIKTSISGKPQAGDVFAIEPSQNQDLFTTVDRFIEALDSSPTSASDKAKLQQEVVNVVTDLDRTLDHINRIRSSVGARMNIIDSSREEHAGMELQLNRNRSDIEDADIAEAVTKLQTRATALEILHKSFTRIEGLTLFNFL
ncbi:MAG: flagellar hook-associated protein FlgL [Granulosicoccus sp.]|nr:flagellar hook-associated protein FlgL [Granulosicoccus sp.]